MMGVKPKSINNKDQIIIDIYKNIIEYMTAEIINTHGQNQIKFLEEWTYKYLLPDIRKKCPGYLTEIESFALKKIIIAKNKLKT